MQENIADEFVDWETLRGSYPNPSRTRGQRRRLS
jgi:hypothetical protein